MLGQGWLTYIHSSPGLTGEEEEQSPEGGGTEYIFLVPSLYLGTGMLAAGLALLRVWLQPSTST